MVPVTNGGLFSSSSVTVAADKQVTCIITNDDDIIVDPPEELWVTKVIVSDNGGTAVLSDFDIEVDDVNVAWSIPNSTTGGTKKVKTSGGTYKLEEANVANYTEGSWSCKDQDDNNVAVTNGGLFSSSSVTVAADKQVTCTITNDDEVIPIGPN